MWKVETGSQEVTNRNLINPDMRTERMYRNTWVKANGIINHVRAVEHLEDHSRATLGVRHINLYNGCRENENSISVSTLYMYMEFRLILPCQFKTKQFHNRPRSY